MPFVVSGIQIETLTLRNAHARILGPRSRTLFLNPECGTWKCVTYAGVCHNLAFSLDRLQSKFLALLEIAIK